MCGIAGIVAGEAAPAPPSWLPRVGAMLAALRHRGPDDEGTAAAGRAAVGAVRLAVIDPPGGAQPMWCPQRRHVLVWNGVITNHVELRAALEARGETFRTTSDTEVLLRALARDGAAALAATDGMFAGAFVDTMTGEVLLFRDPCGIKPLYWADTGDALLFASEPRALLAGGVGPVALDEVALADYLAFQVPLSDRTWFAGIRRVPAGGTLRLRPGAPPAPGRVADWHEAFDVPGTVDDAADVLGGLLRESVRRNLRADVPLGAHLSGGVDSSLVAALARPWLPTLHVFTGAFTEPGFDERPHAAAVAAEIDAVLHEPLLGPEELAESLPHAVRAMDEPAAGPGLLPQWCVARRAAQHVKVVLGGQGGDELFHGYVRHLVLRLEGALRQAVHGGDTRALRGLAGHLAALDGYEPLLRRHFATGLFDPAPERAFRLLFRGEGLAGVLSGDLRGVLERHPVRERFLATYEAVARSADGPRDEAADLVRSDRAVILPALLQVEDRTSMAWSRESRVPLLGRRGLAYVDRVPDHVLLGDGRLKGLLRRAAGDDLPAAARRRTDKMGFPVPLAAWARGPLRSFLRDLLLDGTARGRGLFDAGAVERVLAGDSVEARHLWALVNVETWMRSQAA